MLLLFLVGLPPAFQQNAASLPISQATAPYTFHVTTRDVIVDVIAVDGRNHPILDLHPSDLQVFDQPADHETGKQPEPIVSLSLVDRTEEQVTANEPQGPGFEIASSCLQTATPHYSLAYHPGPQAWASGKHQVVVHSLRRGVHLYYRHSYFVGVTAPPPDMKSLTPEEIQAELRRDACDHPSLPLSIGLRARSVDTGNPSSLRFAVSVDADSLTFISLSNMGRHVQLDYAVCNFDAAGTPLNYFTAEVDQVLNSVDYARAVAHGFPHLLQFPGPLHLAMTRFIIRDRSTGNLGSAEVIANDVEPVAPSEALLAYTKTGLVAAQSANQVQATASAPAVPFYVGMPPQGPMGSFGSIVPTTHSFCGDVFELGDRLADLPDYRELDPIGSIYTRELDVPNQIFANTTGIPGVTPRTNDFGIDYHSSFWVAKPGRYEFMMISDDGARLQIDDTQVIDLDGLHTAQTRLGTIRLDVGRHSMHVPYYQGAPSAVALQLWVKPPSGYWQIFDLDDYLPPGVARPQVAQEASTSQPSGPAAPTKTSQPSGFRRKPASPPVGGSLAIVAGQPISSSARDYLMAALKVLEQHAFDANNVDWKALRTQVIRDAAGAQTPAGTYPAINAACLLLGRTGQCTAFDPSYSAPPEILGKLQEQVSASQVGSADVASSPSLFSGRRHASGKLLTVADGEKLAYVAVAPCGALDVEREECAAQLRLVIVSLASADPEGWIVDLRGDNSKDLWPPLVALGPLLGGDTVGYLKTPQGGQPWIYDKNAVRTQVMYIPDGRYAYTNKSVLWSMSAPPLDLPPRPLAVLIDQGTTGGGKSLAIAFAGRKQEQSFGTPTPGGLVSGPTSIWPLSDGATLEMPKGIVTDRHYHTYPNGVRPDLFVSMDTPTPLDRDPVVRAAEAWLKTEH
jgi:hypothetical protein